MPDPPTLLLASLPPEVAQALVVVWLAALGGAVGSFLNVVVYRLPAGMSLSLPGSHCPVCKSPIRFRDNVPVFGWIFLRGRCRDCSVKISARYPVVEAIAAVVFVALGIVEGLSGGANLPLRPVPVPDGLIFFPLTAAELAGTVSYHLLLLSTLLAAALIEYDGHRLPVRAVVPALVVGVIAPVVWPHLHPVPACPAVLGSGLLDSFTGLGAGSLLGLLAWRLVEPVKRRGFLLGATCVGVFLGWQAVAAVMIASVVLHLLARAVFGLRSHGGRQLPTTWLLLTTLPYLFTWRVLALS